MKKSGVPYRIAESSLTLAFNIVEFHLILGAGQKRFLL
jgi:hypothetical protein